MGSSNHTPKHGLRGRPIGVGLGNLTRRPVVGGLLAVGMLGSIGAGAVGMGQEAPSGAQQQSASSSPDAGSTSGRDAAGSRGGDTSTGSSRDHDRKAPKDSATTDPTREGEKPVGERDYSSEELDIIREDPKPWGRELAFEAGWSEKQWMCLHDLWVGESAWEWDSRNPTSGAYGIPQSLPAKKMAAAGSDWRTNPITQMEWGIRYIEKSYGGPCDALAHWHFQDPHWY